MSSLQVGMVGFDISPRFHPTCGAWGCNPTSTEMHGRLLSRCLALKQDDRLLLWFGSDLIGEGIKDTDALRDCVADALKLEREQVIWSTSQTHASGAIPGSKHTGSCISDLSKSDADFMESERKRLMSSYINAGREVIDRLQDAQVCTGRGYCDSISYNSRFPMPTGGCKFSRNYAEALQSGKYYDPTIGLIRFEDKSGDPIGAIFNFNSHPAVLIINKYISGDYVGAARQCVEDAIGGAPAMFVQGFCGDVHPRHMFGTPQQADRIGKRLGKAAAEAMETLIPVRSTPFAFVHETIKLQCQPVPSGEVLEEQLAGREAFLEEVKDDPQAVWFCGVNLPEQLSPELRAAAVRIQIDYLREVIRMVKAGESPADALEVTLGAVRIGDAAAVLSPGENFAVTGRTIRAQSPFVNTLICGDSNGMFGYIGTDDEIDRGGFETDSYWKMISFNGLRLPLAKGSADRVMRTHVDLLRRLHRQEF